MAAPRPDLSPEFDLKSIPVDAIVRMRSSGKQFADASSVLGLGQGDLVDVGIPSFQRGLKWGKERLMEFHLSLIQGWPIGVMVLAIESSEIINRENNQRRFRLSLIDGQQRSWALSELVGKFWTAPWFTFHSPKWDSRTPVAGPIYDAGQAIAELGILTGLDEKQLIDTIETAAKAYGREIFEDYPLALERLMTIEGWPNPTPPEVRTEVRRLATALIQQEEALKELPVPVLLLNETLKTELPTVFRRLNEGVPLKGYDLLAATWGTSRLLPAKPTSMQKKFLKAVLEVAEDRIADTYAETEDGYEYDPTLEPLELKDLSLFDLLYYLSKQISNSPTVSIKSDVAAFQICALTFNGQIQKVDENLRDAYPLATGEIKPDITRAPGDILDAVKQVELALKPLMDVTAKNLTSFKGKVGLTPSVVYTSTFLTHQYLVYEPKAGGPLALRSRGQSAADRTVRAGLVLNASERAHRLKKHLPSWYVHDSLTSVFAGSRAYEAANDRVWRSFAEGTGSGRKRVLAVSNAMFDSPRLDDLLTAFDGLWDSELSADRTPQRRRVSDRGAVLLRAAYSDLHIHDTDIDHVIPLALGRKAAEHAGETYPLNHVANQMPLAPAINGARKDSDWHTYRHALTDDEKELIARCLLVPWESTAYATMTTRDSFVDFLAERFRALIRKALNNLEIQEWAGLREDEKVHRLSGLALGRKDGEQ